MDKSEKFPFHSCNFFLYPMIFSSSYSFSTSSSFFHLLSPSSFSPSFFFLKKKTSFQTSSNLCLIFPWNGFSLPPRFALPLLIELSRDSSSSPRFALPLPFSYDFLRGFSSSPGQLPTKSGKEENRENPGKHRLWIWEFGC